MAALSAVVFTLSGWLGWYLLARDPRKPVLALAAVGLCGFTLVVALDAVRTANVTHTRLLSQVEGDLDEGLVRFGETRQLLVARQRQCSVAGLNTTAESEPPKLRAGEVGQRADELVLAVIVLRELHCDCCD